MLVSAIGRTFCAESLFENTATWGTSPPGGLQMGPGAPKMGMRRRRCTPKQQLRPPRRLQVRPKGPRSDFGADFGEPKGRPKRGKFGALSLSKLRRDFGAIWGSILERLGVPKRGVLRHNKRVKKQDKDRMRVGENSGTQGKTHILHFRKRPGAKKKEVKRQKIGIQKGERNLAPKRSQNGPFLGPQKWSKSGQKAKQKIVTKKVREKEA